MPTLSPRSQAYGPLDSTRGSDSGETCLIVIPVSEQTLRQRLRQSGLLASIDVGRGMVQVRRTLEGRPSQVLHLIARDLVGPVQR